MVGVGRPQTTHPEIAEIRQRGHEDTTGTSKLCAKWHVHGRRRGTCQSAVFLLILWLTNLFGTTSTETSRTYITTLSAVIFLTSCDYRTRSRPIGFHRVPVSVFGAEEISNTKPLDARTLPSRRVHTKATSMDGQRAKSGEKYMEHNSQANDEIIALEAQVRECFGRVVYSTKTHEKCADLSVRQLGNQNVPNHSVCGNDSWTCHSSARRSEVELLGYA